MLRRSACIAAVVVALSAAIGCSSNHSGAGAGAGGEGQGAGGGASTSTSADQICVDAINAHRATLGLPPYERWSDEETCASDEAGTDSASGEAHSAFGQCGEHAQNECPGWPGPPEQMIGSCLDQMWAEGPGDDFSQHGHYINMSSTTYTKVACGFHVMADGSVWAAQDFH